MFDGSWKESHSDKIDLHITDEDITPESLNTVFSSFYHDEINLTEEVPFHFLKIFNSLNRVECLRCYGNCLIFSIDRNMQYL